MKIHDQLVRAVTEWDRKQSKKRFYNPHSLGIMLQAVDSVSADIDRGADPRKAIMAGFNDRLLDHVLRSVGLQAASVEEHHALPFIYSPIVK